MTTIESVFNKHFAEWKIRLPRGAATGRERGQIVKAGWAIWYLFGADETGEYLDYYASHRMTEDDHVRIRADGECEYLPSIMGMHVSSLDPVEAARLGAAHAAKNQEIARMLEEKGFGIAGNEPMSVQMNRFLRLGEVQ